MLILSNGDTLHGKFVSSIQGKITFHSDPLGDVSLAWDKVKELHTTEKFAVRRQEREAPRTQERRGRFPRERSTSRTMQSPLQPEQGEAHAPLP